MDDEKEKLPEPLEIMKEIRDLQIEKIQQTIGWEAPRENINPKPSEPL